MNKQYEQVAIRVSRISIIGNIALTAFKLFAGIYSHSAAMVSDAIHSLSDVLGSFIVIIGVKLANQKSDKEHPYGHERLECVAAIILSLILVTTGLAIGKVGVERIISGNYDEIMVPGFLALVAAITSIVVKEAMYWYTRIPAKKFDSTALMAEAWHHRSDALSSVGSFAGILGARMGFPILDSIASVVICLFILKVAFSLFMDAIGRMTDKACSDEIIDEFRKVILVQKDVIKIDDLKTRIFGSRIYVDAKVSTDGAASFREAHNVAKRVRQAIEAEFPKVKHCMVHMNPCVDEKNDY